MNAGEGGALDNTNDENGEGGEDTEDIDSPDNYDASQAETNENLDTTKQKQSNQGTFKIIVYCLPLSAVVMYI